MRKASVWCGRLIATCLAAGPFVAQAHAVEYPTRPIKFIVPFAAGGNADLVARLAAAHIQRSLGADIVVENHGGAGGIVGTGLAAKSAGDGHTLCICSIGAISIAPATQELRYD